MLNPSRLPELRAFLQQGRFPERGAVMTDLDRTAAVAAKYHSASRVFASDPAQLRGTLLAQPLSMVFLLNDAPQDRLMAYQHTQRTRFVTHQGVDKRHGAQAIARHLGVELADSVGAGDAEPDTFLQAVGLAVIVGNAGLGFKGLRHTVRVPDVHAWGDLLFALGDAAE